MRSFIYWSTMKIGGKEMDDTIQHVTLFQQNLVTQTAFRPARAREIGQ